MKLIAVWSYQNRRTRNGTEEQARLILFSRALDLLIVTVAQVITVSNSEYRHAHCLTLN